MHPTVGNDWTSTACKLRNRWSYTERVFVSDFGLTQHDLVYLFERRPALVSGVDMGELLMMLYYFKHYPVQDSFATTFGYSSRDGAFQHVLNPLYRLNGELNFVRFSPAFACCMLSLAVQVIMKLFVVMFAICSCADMCLCVFVCVCARVCVHFESD